MITINVNNIVIKRTFYFKALPIEYNTFFLIEHTCKQNNLFLLFNM